MIGSVPVSIAGAALSVFFLIGCGSGETDRDGDRRLLRRLTCQLRSDKIEEVRAATLSVTEEGIEPLFPVLFDNAFHRDPRIRFITVSAAAAAGDRAFAPVFLNALADSNSLIRTRALKGLAESEYLEAALPISDCLKDPSRQVRLGATAALGRLKALEGIPPLLERWRASGNTLEEATAWKSLREISGIDLPREISLWTRWWEPVREP
ncbi:MAG TPA: HEAT repeat domain-containing protein [bacterium]|nr:HEAT repeat domain-containing protein [bacterium]HPQ65597.1 HEAT repeat domain-containing protein [bacterium]